MKRLRSVAIGLAAMAMMVMGWTGCGQKGPLTLPSSVSAHTGAASTPSGK